MERDKSNQAIMARYQQASIVAVSVHSGPVFQSLMDIPDLIKDKEVLEGKVKDQSVQIEYYKERERAMAAEIEKLHQELAKYVTPYFRAKP